MEDNPADVILFREALNENHINVDLTVAQSGEEALEILHQCFTHDGGPCPNLMFLDINLPGISGIDVLSKIKLDPSLKVIPVVMLTTSSAEKDYKSCYNLNVNCYLVKSPDYFQFTKQIISIFSMWFVLAPPLAEIES